MYHFVKTIEDFSRKFGESFVKALAKDDLHLKARWPKTVDLLRQNWPMKVSKDQHLKAERKCLSAAAAEWSVTRDQTPGTIWGYHAPTFFLKIFANVYRERKTWSSRKFGERIFFGEDDVFQMKEFRTTLIYKYSTILLVNGGNIPKSCHFAPS